MPATLPRRILGLLPALGVTVHDVAPGLAVVARRVPVKVRRLKGGSALVLRQGAHRATSLGRGLHLVGPAGMFSQQDRATRDKAVSDWLALQHLRDILRQYRVDVVLDVGANKGQYATGLRKAGFEGRIISFEPVPEVFAKLSEAAAGDELWEVHQLGLGRSDGELEMHVVPGTMSSMLPPSQFGTDRYESLRQVTVQKVPVRRLEDFLDEVLPAGSEPPRILLKMDTQGFDLEVFGGLGSACDLVVAMQSEVALLTIYDHMPRMPEALSVYEGAGFEVTGMYPVSRERRTARVLEYDCVMVRAAAL